MRARLMVRYARSSETAVERFGEFVNGSAESPAGETLAARYGYAVALLENGQPDAAADVLEKLLTEVPGRISFVVSLSRAYIEAAKLDQANELLERHLERNPGNFPITHALANLALTRNEPQKAARLFERLSRQYPNDASLWQSLAEAQGKARNIVSVHRARAEHALLMGDPERAMLHLREALKKASEQPAIQEMIRSRMEDAREQIRQQKG